MLEPLAKNGKILCISTGLRVKAGTLVACIGRVDAHGFEAVTSWEGDVMCVSPIRSCCYNKDSCSLGCCHGIIKFFGVVAEASGDTDDVDGARRFDSPVDGLIQ